MKHETFDIHYPPIQLGCEKTSILYFETIQELTKKLKENIDNALIVTDDVVFNIPGLKDFFAGIPTETCLVLPAGEKYKTIETVLSILERAMKLSLTRKSLFVGIGGGVITDLLAFAASIFKRGARLELVPTTLLAMVDAAIGGKTGCDFKGYKNSLGTFYPASKLYISPEFIQSQSEDEFRSGLAEVFKTGLLFSEKLVLLMQDEKDALLNRDQRLLMNIIKRCAQAKAQVVEKDLTEKNIRMWLNLGHTFAHALETVLGLGTISHGEAVAWGISRAIALSESIGLCAAEYQEEVFSMLKAYNWSTDKIHPKCIELKIENCSEKLIEAMKQDKKNIDSNISFVLQRGINDSIIEKISEDKIRSILS
ncbi:MAG TPA: 3-dehydroquinate synthase family protein [Treponemataceae bacterium]|nr:3-dehydroquinate synthase family protein [Treponemataceae bacterium]